jgi:EAL domain-containing protein (putative c-di-GMP-specific phosphodiesterase class I)/DNA-binding NarL/FixJ family response regulator
VCGFQTRDEDRAVTPHTVLIADDDREFLTALAAVVERSPSLRLVGAASDATEAIALGRRHQPAVAVVDARMDGGGGARVATELTQLTPGTRILALSAYDDHRTVVEMIEAGAVGYLLKGTSASALVEVIERTAMGPVDPAKLDGAPVPDTLQRDSVASPIRVIIADDSPEFLEALSLVIEGQGDLELVGRARDTYGAIRLAAMYKPDVALVDWRMPGGGAIATAEILRSSPDTRVVAVSVSREREAVVDMLRAGAASYVVKSVTEHDLLDIVRTTAAGSAVLSQEVATDVLNELILRMELTEDPKARDARKTAAVRSVIDTGALTMVFQPIVSLKGGELVGVEALARFDVEPRRSPNVWFDEASDVALDTELDMAAAERALAAMPKLPPGVALFMNVRPASLFSNRFAELVAAVNAESVVLELTEHAPVHDYPRLLAALETLRDRGFRVAVDDVGAGYASLRHLLNLRPDMLKIDISLCRHIEDDRARQVLAEGLVSLGRELGATVVAEGIETAEELEAVRKLGVDVAQGYFLGRPAPPPVDDLFALDAPARGGDW